ncbi:MAG: phosphoserine phosphatase SerB [Burkholderiales bacterium]|nr:phosphoserine phosphatase SerB [Burkholderiales bacterium]
MNLIVQGLEVYTRDLKEIAKLARASGIERVGDEAFRLRDAQPASGIAAYCEAARLDHAFVPESVRLADFGLVAMDMDSTLITIECIDELADLAGRESEVGPITAAAMRGELDFAESLKQRVALLAGLGEDALERVYTERLALTPGAESMLAAMHDRGIRTLLVSGGFTYFTDRLRERLGLDCARGTALEIEDGKITGRLVGEIVDAARKARAMREVRDALGLATGRVLAIGDGANDLALMAEAGFSIAFHAKPAVKARATYALDFVGLDGVVNLFA